MTFYIEDRVLENLPCADNVAELAKNGVTCSILVAQGCDSNLSQLAAQQGVPFPEKMPPEARVKDACPMSCNVCSGMH